MSEANKHTLPAPAPARSTVEVGVRQDLPTLPGANLLPPEHTQRGFRLAAGTLLHNRYQIRSHLGEGGMASVYVAWDLSLHREVAVKVVHPHLATLRTSHQRFLREARTMASLDSPFLVPVYDVGMDGRIVFLVMKLLKAPSLADLVYAPPGVVPSRLALWMVQVLEGLAVLHEKGLIHRDLKPNNILIPSEERAVLLDMGLVLDPTDEAITSEGVIMGTPEYMSPEQVMRRDIDGRSDLYAVGVTLYESLARQVPLVGSSAVDTCFKHMNQVPPPLRTYVPDLPGEAEAFVARALAKDPADRFSSALDMARALKALIQVGAFPDHPVRVGAAAVRVGVVRGGTEERASTSVSSLLGASWLPSQGAEPAQVKGEVTSPPGEVAPPSGYPSPPPMPGGAPQVAPLRGEATPSGPPSAGGPPLKVVAAGTLLLLVVGAGLTLALTGSVPVAPGPSAGALPPSAATPAGPLEVATAAPSVVALPPSPATPAGPEEIATPAPTAAPPPAAPQAPQARPTRRGKAPASAAAPAAGAPSARVEPEASLGYELAGTSAAMKAEDLPPDVVGEARRLLAGGQVAAAKSLLETARRERPEIGIYPLLGDIYRSMGNREGAIASYRRYLREQPGGPEADRVRAALSELEGG